MPNHYHLLIETPRPNLSHGMRHLNGVYAQTYNRNHGLRGHVWGGRFKSILVEKDAYLLVLSGYIARNPRRWRPPLGTLDDYRWSSYRALAGLEPAPPWLTTDWLLGQFARRRQVAQRRYADFVREQVPANPWRDLKGDVYLGSAEFARTHAIADDLELEIPIAHKRPTRRALADIFDTDGDRAIACAHYENDYTLREIGAFCGVHYSTISRRLSRLRG
jgi:putative transposase